MFSLVKYSDCSYEITKTALVKFSNNEYIVKCKGSGYKVDLINSNDDIKKLKKLLNKLEKEENRSQENKHVMPYQVTEKENLTSKEKGHRGKHKSEKKNLRMSIKMKTSSPKGLNDDQQIQKDESINNCILNDLDQSTTDLPLQRMLPIIVSDEIIKSELKIRIENSADSDIPIEINNTNDLNNILNLELLNDSLPYQVTGKENLTSKEKGHRGKHKSEKKNLRMSIKMKTSSPKELNDDQQIQKDESINNSILNDLDQSTTDPPLQRMLPIIVSDEIIKSELKIRIENSADSDIPIEINNTNDLNNILNLELLNDSLLSQETEAGLASENVIDEPLLINSKSQETVVGSLSENVIDQSFSFNTINEAVDGESLNISRIKPSRFDSDSGSEYVPSDTESNEDANDYNNNTRNLTSNTSKNQAANTTKDLESSCKINTLKHSAPDDEIMFVKTVESGSKRDNCFYCNVQQARLDRHILRRHKNEELVMKFLSYPKLSEERRHIMAEIRKKGMFAFNTNESINTGERKVVRRPNNRYKRIASDFATCPNCFGDYAKNSLRHHVRRCCPRKNNKKRDILLNSKRVTGRIHRDANDILRKQVFPTMQEDNVIKSIRYDKLVILFGNKLCLKYKDPHFYDMIRQKLRQLGRFLLELRKYAPNVNDLFGVYTPQNYDAVISAIHSLAGINETQTGFKTPSLAMSISTLLKQVGKLCISEHIKCEDREKQIKAENFLKLLVEDYTTSIGRTALETYASQKRRKTIVLPSAADIQKLQIYLHNEVRNNYNTLDDKFSTDAWINLGSAILISLQLFNRRRAGEMERILIEDFKNYQKINEDTIGESYNKLSTEEKNIAQNYVRFEIRGKLNRTVPVLLHKDLLTCIERLLALRKEAKVHKENPYLFGIAGKLRGDFKYLRACGLMRNYAERCGAEKPETLRGTILRKHIATMCINFNLTENQVSDLADFMGHAERIHKEHYRQPILKRQLVDMTQILVTIAGQTENESGEEEEENDDRLNHATSPVKRRKTRSTSPYGKCKRIRWAEKERVIAMQEFAEYIQMRKLPSFEFIQNVINKHPGVFERSIASVKTWVSNQIKKQTDV